MKLLTVFGIIIPSLIVLFVLIVGIFDVGVSIEQYSPSSVSKASIFIADSSNRTPVRVPEYGYSTGQNVGPTIRTIKVTNNFIFQRRENLDYVICIEGSKDYYSQFLNYQIYVDEKPYSTDIYSRQDYVNINSGETKTIELKVLQQSNYNNEQAANIVIFKDAGKNYYNCQNLLKENAKSGIRIKLE